MKTKILAGVILMTIATAGTLTYAASTTGTGNVLRNAFSGMHRTGSGGFNTEHLNKRGGGEMRGFGQMNSSQGFGFMGKGALTQLTDAEKTKFATITPIEKKAFFEAKMTEQKALRDAKEGVIDKVINGEPLSDTEKATLTTIKTERATMKAERVAREAKLAEIQPIMAKVKVGTTLTTDEQTKLNAFKKEMKQGGKKEGRGGMMGR